MVFGSVEAAVPLVNFESRVVSRVNPDGIEAFVLGHIIMILGAIIFLTTQAESGMITIEC